MLTRKIILRDGCVCKIKINENKKGYSTHVYTCRLENVTFHAIAITILTQN